MKKSSGMLQGSYTIEAAVLVSLILLILLSWFYLAFSFHDRLVCHALALFYTEGAGRMLEEPISAEGRLEIERLNERKGILTTSYVSGVDPSVFEERFLSAADMSFLISRPESFRLSARKAAVNTVYTAATLYPPALPVFSFLYESRGISGETQYGLPVTPETFIRAARGLIWRES